MKHKIYDLIGSKCNGFFIAKTKDIGFPLDLFVINFSNEIHCYSFHSFALVRAIEKNRVFYSITDEYLNTDGFEWRRGQKKASKITYELLKKLIINHYVKTLIYKKYGDVIITFDNDVEIQFLVDSTPLHKQDIHRLLISTNNKNSIKKSEFEHFPIYVGDEL